MHISFTKMHGAGNDFIVLDETQNTLGLQAAHYRLLANRHFGIGADQILTVGAATSSDVDFSYRIHNADGNEVEHCGNGARCFVRFVREQGLSDKTSIRVATKNRTLTLQEHADGLVSVDMQAPICTPESLPFIPDNLPSTQQQQATVWHVPSPDNTQPIAVAIASMGNPHAVLQVPDVDNAPVQTYGRHIQQLPCFPNSVNVGFMQVVSPKHIKLRVYERGAGETLACGTGACAAVVCGMQMGVLETNTQVQVDVLGGTLYVHWAGSNTSVLLSGVATTVFHGKITLPNPLPSFPHPL